MSPSSEVLPVVSVDTHFRNVPGLKQVDVDPPLYRDYLIAAGLPEAQVGDIELFVRPDYKLAYSRGERIRMFLRNPFYDNVSGSCEPSVNGGVKVTVVYGTHYGVNKLLRHETRHAIKMLSNDTVDKDVENPCRWTTAAMLGPLVVGDAVSCFSGERAPGLIGSILTLGMAVKQIVKSRRESRIEEDDADLDMYDKRLAKKYPIIYITKQKP